MGAIYARACNHYRLRLAGTEAAWQSSEIVF
jgi:hypothetical protein